VQADQQDTTLLCQTMQVYLNRPVSLSQRPGQARGDQKEPANVDKVVCEAGDRPQGVMIKETKLEAGRLISTKWVEADEVAIYKDEGRMVAANHGNARGNVRIVQLGPKSESGVGPRPPAGGTPKPTELEYKLTWVRYSGTMNVKNQSRTAHFYDGVEVLHLPLDAADRLPAFDTTVNRLPAGALHLRATQMTVYSAKDATGQTRQAMTAEGKAEVLWGEEFFGKADVIRFDEVKQQMTMEGLNGGIAVARRLRPKPGEPSTMRARKIIYNRRDDSILMDGVYSATGD
jgi:lipopolysaccharide export system protein LptA